MLFILLSNTPKYSTMAVVINRRWQYHRIRALSLSHPLYCLDNLLMFTLSNVTPILTVIAVCFDLNRE
jgi:hypothetical protein